MEAPISSDQHQNEQLRCLSDFWSHDYHNYEYTRPLFNTTAHRLKMSHLK